MITAWPPSWALPGSRSAPPWPPPGYRIALEEGHTKREADWTDFAFIPCRIGQIYKFDRETIAAWIERPKRTHFEKLKRSGLPGKPFVETDGGGVWLFPATNFNELAVFMGARKRRTMGDVQREEAIERLKKWREHR